MVVKMVVAQRPYSGTPVWLPRDQLQWPSCLHFLPWLSLNLHLCICTNANLCRGEQQQEDSSPSAPPLPSEAQLPGPFPLGPQHGRSTSASSSVAGSAGAATIASAPALAHSLPAAAAAAGIMQAGPGVAVLAPPQGQGPPPRRLHSSGGSGLSLGSSMGSTSLASSTSMGSADIAVAAELVKAPVNAWSTPVKGGGLALQPSGSSLGSELEAAAAAGGFVVGKAWAKPASDYPLVLIQVRMRWMGNGEMRADDFSHVAHVIPPSSLLTFHPAAHDERGEQLPGPAHDLLHFPPPTNITLGPSYAHCSCPCSMRRRTATWSSIAAARSPGRAHACSSRWGWQRFMPRVVDHHRPSSAPHFELAEHAHTATLPTTHPSHTPLTLRVHVWSCLHGTRCWTTPPRRT